MTEKKDAVWTEVRLLEVGVSSRSGNIYPEATILEAIEKLKKRPALFGEIRDSNTQPFNIDESKISHQFDLQTLDVKDGYVTCLTKPVGVFGEVFQGLLDKPPVSMAMRAHVGFAADNKTVNRLEIVTFDLCNQPPL